MLIPIHDGKKEIAIGSDEYSFTICEKRTRKGGAAWEAVQWFVDPASLFAALLRRKVRNSDAKTLKELKVAIEKARREILEVWSLDKAA